LDHKSAARFACGWRIGKFWRESLGCSPVQIGRRDNFSTHARSAPPGDPRSAIARDRRAPNLTTIDRLVLTDHLFVSSHRIPKLSASLKPATLFKFHKALVHRKYRLVFSSSCRRRKRKALARNSSRPSSRRRTAIRSSVVSGSPSRCAEFAYDAASETFMPTQKDAKCGAACHEIAAAKDYIFTAYGHR
jgi:hypothetical protein